MIGPDDVAQAADRIRSHIRRTPVLRVAVGDLGLPFAVDLKLESLQHTGSFKPRGAFNSILSANVPPAGVVAASGGNHGAAVAFAAAKLGVPARIFVPEMAGKTKIGVIRNAGVEPDVVAGAYADAFDASEIYQRHTGALSIHAYDAPGTLAGQGTLGIEIEDQIDGLDILLIAVGGGGLIGGIVTWMANRVRIVGVEPRTAQALTAALANGPDTDVEVSGAAANSLGASRIGRLPYEICVKHEIETVLVDDDAIRDAQRRLWSATRVLTEPGGAAALAALTSGAFKAPAGARVGVLICGGNSDPDPLAGPS
ncbi:MAG: serine/threonine dehydratase [Pseudomonadota bacterium]